MRKKKPVVRVPKANAMSLNRGASRSSNRKPEVVTIYAERSINERGDLFYKALRVVVPEDLIELKEAARILGLSVRRLNTMCVEGVIRSAHKPGYGINARWRVSRSEVLARLEAQAG